MKMTNIDSELVSAVLEGDLEEVKTLLNRGANVNTLNCCWTPLFD